ncbi:MAG: fumarate hydratase [Chloroflexi bacterium]|nr:fumarate hydratase [Chloroflexota bacterium]
MREIQASEITKAVARLCQEANFVLGKDVLSALEQARQAEESLQGKEVLGKLLENARIAVEERVPLCQDCGTAVIFLEIGQDIHIAGGDLHDAIFEGVCRGYGEGCLRLSMVRQPFSGRVNTRDNTPPVVHTKIVPGDRLRIIVMPKGGGAENMSRLAMLKPGEGRQGIVEFVLKTVAAGGGSPCPPGIIGVGIGATAEMAMFLAKKALLRTVGEPSPDPETAALERDLLARINDLGIGPQGWGGRVTALAVHVEVRPTHLASLPVAVNLQCHSARHAEAIL